MDIQIEKFSRNLGLLRRARGYTQAIMAEKLDIARSTYAGYETGSRSPDIEMLVKIADTLDVSIDELLQRDHRVAAGVMKEEKTAYGQLGTVYHIMHGEQLVASVDTEGKTIIYAEDFMPYNLYFEDNPEDLGTRFNNLANFYFWCASRVLTLDRKYAKEILNSIGMTQAVTDKERAQIALSYHCLSLTDIYWVKEDDEEVEFCEISLFDHPLDNAFVDVSLRGKQMTITNSYLIADDISTGGLFPKAWYREQDGIVLLKDGDPEAVKGELLASRICQCFECRQVIYQEAFYDGTLVTKSRLMTSRDYSIVPMEAFEIYAVNHGIDVQEYVESLDEYSYHMMNILDYLTGNTDRHWGNWGFLVDNSSNRPIRLHDLMDFNRAFTNYETLEGANCLTVPHGLKISQRQAAEEAVRKIGLNQLGEVEEAWFDGNKNRLEMFENRLGVLKDVK